MADANETSIVVPETVSNLSISSRAIHSDDVLNDGRQDVAPALHVSTTFRYSSDPDKLVPINDSEVSYPDPHMYFFNCRHSPEQNLTVISTRDTRHQTRLALRLSSPVYSMAQLCHMRRVSLHSTPCSSFSTQNVYPLAKAITVAMVSSIFIRNSQA